MIRKKQLFLKTISFLILLLVLWNFNYTYQPVNSRNSHNSDFTITATPDIYEDDDSFVTAKNITLNSVQNRSISDVGDVDYAKFELDSYYNLEISTDGLSGDTRLWLYDGNEQLLTFNDDSGNNMHAQIIADPLPPGIYYIKVDEFANDQTIDSYNLTLTASLAEDIFDPDGCSSPAYLPLNSMLKRSIYPIGDVDIITFIIPISGSNFSLTTSGDSGDTTLLLCYDCSNPISTMIDYDDGIGSRENITIINSPAMVYYAIVEDYSNNNEILYYEINLEATNIATENDNVGPTITDIQTIPDVPLSANSVDVMASITDISGIKNATLCYRINYQEWKFIDMFYAFNTYYFAGIEPLDVGDFVEYYIASADKSYLENGATEENNGYFYNFTAQSPELYDLYEKDNAFSKSHLMSFNSTIERSISPIGDVDYINFECTEMIDILIEITAAEGDSFIQLFDSSKILIESDDDSGTGNLSSISITLDTGNYTAEITEDGNNAILNHYNLSLLAFQHGVISEYSKILGLVVSSITVLTVVILRKNNKK